MAAINVEAIAIDITVISALFTFVNVRTGETVSAVPICACAGEPTNAVCTACHCVTTGLTIGTLINISALTIPKHEPSQTGTMEGARVVDA